MESNRDSFGKANEDDIVYEWDSYDHSGKAYDAEKIDFLSEDHWDNLYSLNRGNILAWLGLIFGMFFSALLIVFGFIWPRKSSSQKIIILFRALTGILLLIPSVFLIVCGAKYIGYSVSVSTTQIDEYSYLLLNLAPWILMIGGIVTAKMTFKSINNQYMELTSMSHYLGKSGNSFVNVFSKRYKEISKGLVVIAIFSISSLHVLPIVSNTGIAIDEETGEGYNYYYSTSVFFTKNDELYEDDMGEARDDLSLVDTFFWLIFCFACIALFGSFINIPVFSRKAGSIIGLVSNIILIFVILVVYFKILFIINVYGDNSNYGDFWENAWYGYNYIPSIMIIIMIFRSISYCKNSFKVFSSRKLKESISPTAPYIDNMPTTAMGAPAYPTQLPPPQSPASEPYQQRPSLTLDKEIPEPTSLNFLERIDINPSSPSKEVTASMRNTIPDYTITHKLGSGGFAMVYQAEDRNGRLVAIKMPKFLDETLDSSIYEKFESEAKMWNNLSHKNIVEFHEYVLEPVPCLVMEIMQGGSLKSLMDSRRLSTQEALSIFIQLVDAISYAHRMASVHRDIKPENVLFTGDGIPKLTDWGIGKLMASESATKTVGTKGTLAYSAPEQISKKKYGQVDWSTDIFQIGIVGYEMLTDYNPFQDDDPIGIMGKITNEEVPAPSDYNPEIPPQVEKVILKALEKRKENRWRSADVMYDRLRRAMG